MRQQIRKETREKLEQHNLACDLHKIIAHFFPQLIRKLKEVKAEVYKIAIEVS